jgi:hypothetical protein
MSRRADPATRRPFNTLRLVQVAQFLLWFPSLLICGIANQVPAWAGVPIQIAHVPAFYYLSRSMESAFVRARCPRVGLPHRWMHEELDCVPDPEIASSAFLRWRFRRLWPAANIAAFVFFAAGTIWLRATGRP